MTPHSYFLQFIVFPALVIFALVANVWWAHQRQLILRAGLALACAGLLLLNIASAYKAGQLAMLSQIRDGASLSVDTDGGCSPDAPKLVPYYPGMTLCPGQSAVGVMKIPVEPPPDPVNERHL